MRRHSQCQGFLAATFTTLGDGIAANGYLALDVGGGRRAASGSILVASPMVTDFSGCRLPPASRPRGLAVTDHVAVRTPMIRRNPGQPVSVMVIRWRAARAARTSRAMMAGVRRKARVRPRDLSKLNMVSGTLSGERSKLTRTINQNKVGEDFVYQRKLG